MKFPGFSDRKLKSDFGTGRKRSFGAVVKAVKKLAKKLPSGKLGRSRSKR